jgi:hypothetical protein
MATRHLQDVQLLRQPAIHSEELFLQRAHTPSGRAKIRSSRVTIRDTSTRAARHRLSQQAGDFDSR